MKQSMDKYSVAWFKLAECIARGERERALGVYRLLSHSFDDRATAHQLEGDILLAFNDPAGAIAKYQQAAQHYQESGKLHHAAAVYEHLSVLKSDEPLFLSTSMKLYRQLGMLERVAQLTERLVTAAIQARDWQRVQGYLDDLEIREHALRARLHELIFTGLYAVGEQRDDLLMRHLYCTIDELFNCHNPHLLAQFLSRLCVMDQLLHDLAVSYLREKKG